MFFRLDRSTKTSLLLNAIKFVGTLLCVLCKVPFMFQNSPFFGIDAHSDTVSNEIVAQIDYFILNPRGRVLGITGSMIQMVFEFWIIFGFPVKQ